MPEARGKVSSGTVLYRIVNGEVEVLLVHPAGNYNRRGLHVINRKVDP